MAAAYAVSVPGDRRIYRDLGLVESTALTLLMEASSLDGVLPRAGDTVTWNDTDYTVRDVDTLAPDGDPILHTLVVSV